MKYHTMKTLLTAASALMGAVLVVGQCYLPSAWVCGRCTGCTYVVVCGLDGIELCTGDSSGTFVPDVMSAPFGFNGVLPVPSLCMAPVTLSGTCCGGARTTTTDWTPVLQRYPVIPNCPP